MPNLEAADVELMADVPERPLGLGGEILVVQQEGQIRRAVEVSPVVNAQAERLDRLASQIRLFVAGESRRQWHRARSVDGKEAVEARVASAIEAALGRSSLR
ncbi:MAG: hypothetical protein U5K30_05780 [Acidimicrobiales bacterium]|nr:hypothetical protein [Acidimicrobiales bacterium]